LKSVTEFTGNLKSVTESQGRRARPGSPLVTHPFPPRPPKPIPPEWDPSHAGSRRVTVLPVTTSANRRFHPTKYVEITDLNGAGVTRPSGVALRPLEIDRIELIALVGELSDEDHEALFASPHFARATSSPMATGARPTEVHDHFDPSREASG
jgi:hypothetical protein